MDAPTLVKKYQSLYNSPTFSDVTIILPPKRGKKRKKNDGGPALEDTAERIFAHKVILGSASSVLESHFKKASASASGTDFKLKIAELHMFFLPEHYVVLLRFMYGFPLDDKIEGMDILEIKELYDAAVALGIKDLRAYALKKMEERLVKEAHIASCPSEERPPLPTNNCLDLFVDSVDTLLRTDERTAWYLDPDEVDKDIPAVVTVAVKVCCKYYTVIRQNESFKSLGQRYPRLAWDMLDYIAALGSDTLGID